MDLNILLGENPYDPAEDGERGRDNYRAVASIVRHSPVEAGYGQKIRKENNGNFGAAARRDSRLLVSEDLTHFLPIRSFRNESRNRLELCRGL